jgi:hypothetical protein
VRKIVEWHALPCDPVQDLASAGWHGDARCALKRVGKFVICKLAARTDSVSEVHYDHA